MPTVHIQLRFTTSTEYHHLTRTVDMPQVPRQGDSIILTDDDWVEEVNRVFWKLDGSAQIDINAGAIQHPDDIAEIETLVETLTDHGWRT